MLYLPKNVIIIIAFRLQQTCTKWTQPAPFASSGAYKCEHLVCQTNATNAAEYLNKVAGKTFLHLFLRFGDLRMQEIDTSPHSSRKNSFLSPLKKKLHTPSLCSLFALKHVNYNVGQSWYTKVTLFQGKI